MHFPLNNLKRRYIELIRYFCLKTVSLLHMYTSMHTNTNGCWHTDKPTENWFTSTLYALKAKCKQKLCCSRIQQQNSNTAICWRNCLCIHLVLSTVLVKRFPGPRVHFAVNRTSTWGQSPLVCSLDYSTQSDWPVPFFPAVFRIASKQTVFFQQRSMASNITSVFISRGKNLWSKHYSNMLSNGESFPAQTKSLQETG